MHLSDLLQVPVVLMPLPLTEALANLAYQRVLSNHAALFERLDAHRERRFGFIASDLPLAFVVKPSEGRIKVRRRPMPQDAVDDYFETPMGVHLEIHPGH